MMKVLVFGSLNIDYNYLIALARAGATVYQVGSIGEDGRFLLEMLRESKVNVDYINVRSDLNSGNAIIQIDKEGDNCILLYGGANQALSKEYIDSVFEHFGKDDFIVLQNEINEMAYIMNKARATGMTIVLNPSPMNPKLEEYPLDMVDYFILKEVEAGQMVKASDCEFDGGKILDELHLKFPEARIVLTMGRQGSLYKDKTLCVTHECYKVKTVDTTAAGDTYTGYLIAALQKWVGVNEAMDLASRASALTVGRLGAAPPIPFYEEVMQWSSPS